MDTNDPIPSPGRRRAESPRLRTLTAGVAVAGVAATAGLGLVAAQSTHQAPPVVTTDGATPASTAAPVADPFTARQSPDGNGFQPSAGNGLQPPAGLTGPGHATTGGS